VTQRPNKIHQDALSMCNSQIIMRLTNTSDQNAVADASEALSRELLNDLPGLNVGEAIVLGPIVRRPAIVNITQRATAEGGADRDVMADLERARKAAKGVQSLKPSSTTMKKAEPSSPIKVVRPTQGDKK